MKINSRVAMVGSGTGLGFGLTHPLDCQVYLLDGGSELALVDAGVGIEPEKIINVLKSDGYDPRKNLP